MEITLDKVSIKARVARFMKTIIEKGEKDMYGTPSVQFRRGSRESPSMLSDYVSSTRYFNLAEIITAAGENEMHFQLEKGAKVPFIGVFARAKEFHEGHPFDVTSDSLYFDSRKVVEVIGYLQRHSKPYIKGSEFERTIGQHKGAYPF